MGHDSRPAGDFILIQRDPRGWLGFQNPRGVIRANRTEDIRDALSEIDRAVRRDGLYAAGYLAYEAAPAFDPAFSTHSFDSFPLLCFGLYESPEFFSGLPPQAPGQEEPGRNNPGTGLFAGDWEPTVSPEAYRLAFDQIKNHIARGDTYQVNYTFRLRAFLQGSAWAFFRHLAQAQMAGYAAYLDMGSHIVCSASPELFFRLDRDLLTLKPMKGTLRRSTLPEPDSTQADLLRASEKDRAENLMIVDMVRNDVGRIARTGSVRVPCLFEIEPYPTVFQMTSTVEGQTLAEFPEIMAALFPCASITGAPKIRTMEIIRALEADPRGIYTGAIGYIGPGRQAVFNVAIRTAAIDCRTNTAEYGVGGGIVWDSDWTREYQECLDKARILPGIP